MRADVSVMADPKRLFGSHQEGHCPQCRPHLGLVVSTRDMINDFTALVQDIISSINISLFLTVNREKNFLLFILRLLFIACFPHKTYNSLILHMFC